MSGRERKRRRREPEEEHEVPKVEARITKRSKKNDRQKKNEKKIPQGEDSSGYLNVHQMKVLEKIKNKQKNIKQKIPKRNKSPPNVPSTSTSRRSVNVSTPKKDESPSYEDMEWDSIVREVNEYWKSEKTSKNLTFENRLKSKYTSDTYVIVDTNIYLSHLQLIMDLVDNRLGKKVVIVVAWRVIRELDGLKKDEKFSFVGRQVLNFFHDNLKNNDRLIGQSLEDANDYIFPCHNSDDEILNCCLQFSRLNKSVVLLSNDKNLRTKATLNRINSYSYDEFTKDFLSTKNDSILFNDTKPSFIKENVRTSVSKSLLDSYKDIETSMRDFLSPVLEREMKIRYEELWLNIVFLKPPWTLSDILDCISKHWIAVFGEVLPKNAQDSVKNVKYFFPRRRKVSISSFSEFKTLAMDCQQLTKYFQAIDVYKASAFNCSKNISSVLDSCNKDDTSPIMTKESVKKAIASPEKRVEIQLPPPKLPEPIADALTLIWNSFTTYCSQLANCLGVSHTLTSSSSTLTPLPQLIEQADAVSSQINLFLDNVSSVLVCLPISPNSPEYKRTKANTAVMELYNCLCNTVAGIGQPGLVFGLAEFSEYCCNNCNVLEDGYNKFTMLKRLLLECSEQYSKMRMQF